MEYFPTIVSTRDKEELVLLGDIVDRMIASSLGPHMDTGDTSLCMFSTDSCILFTHERSAGAKSDDAPGHQCVVMHTRLTLRKLTDWDADEMVCWCAFIFLK